MYYRRTALKITDTERHDQLLAMIEGKRLTYRRAGEASHAQAEGAKAHRTTKEETEVNGEG